MLVELGKAKELKKNNDFIYATIYVLTRETETKVANLLTHLLYSVLVLL